MSPRTAAQNEEIRAASKQKILDAAFKLIAKNGYESTSIAQIAKEAGVAKGLLYNYFDSKQSLVEAMVTAAMQEGDAILAELVTSDPQVMLENLFRWFFSEMRERPDHWRLLTELTLKIDKFSFVHDFATAKMNEYVGLLESLLSQMGYENALGEARIIVALFDGIGIEALVLKEDYPLDEMEEFLINKYCNNN